MSNEDLLDWMENNSLLVERLRELDFEGFCNRLGLDPSTLTAEQQMGVERFMLNSREMATEITA